jgi:hypothetical protein
VTDSLGRSRDTRLAVVSFSMARELPNLNATAVAAAGDIDGDGRADFLVAYDYEANGAMTNAGSVSAYSGATGALLWKTYGPSVDLRFGTAIARCGSDVLVGAPPYASYTGRVFVLTAATGTIYATLDPPSPSSQGGFGSQIVCVGDVNSDTVPDFAASAPNETIGSRLGVGSVYEFSGATRALIATNQGQAEGEYFGQVLAGGGDLDGDGVPDLLAASLNASDAAGKVVGLQGGAGNRLFAINGVAAGDELGRVAMIVRDSDGDGRADILVGATSSNFQRRKLSLISTASLATVASFPYEGNSAVVLGDLDRDGRAEYIETTGLGFSSYGGFAVRSTRADNATWHLEGGQQPNEYLGQNIAAIGDVNGDGVPDLIATTHQPCCGNVRVYASNAPPPPPARPIQVSVGATGATSLTVSWVSAEASATGFRIEHRKVGAEWTLGATAPSGVAAHTLTSLDRGAAYDVRVFTITPAGLSSASPVVSATTLP